MSKIVIIISFMILSCVIVFNLLAGGRRMESVGIVYVNDVVIQTEMSEGLSFVRSPFPFLEILEAIEVAEIVEASEEKIFFNFAGIEYVCQFVQINPHFEQKYILISEVANLSSRMTNDDFIQLNPMSADGDFVRLNDKVYLYRETGQRLFEALGCRVEIDMEQRVVRIYCE